jgi:uncharacterized protein YggE
MKRMLLSMAFLCTMATSAPAQQSPEIKFVADTLVVQAEGTYEADPDLATLTFNISSQDKELKHAYDSATQSMQRIVALADKTGLKKADVSTGALTLVPSYERDRKSKPKAYTVQGEITLKVHDFSQIGALLDGAVEDGIVDFRSLTYSLQDEEAAKERAVSQAMQRAVGRATAALTESGQKLGPVRYANLDVRQLVGIVPTVFGQLSETIDVEGLSSKRKPAPPPPVMPPMQPEKITVSATVQCAFAIK